MVALGSGSTLRILGPLPPFEIQKISYSLSFHAGVHAGVRAGVCGGVRLRRGLLLQVFLLASAKVFAVKFCQGVLPVLSISLAF